MARLQPKETIAVRERIVAVTREGRLQDWNERIGEIATIANVNLGEIKWCQSPELVARELIDYFNCRDAVEELFAAITAYETSHKP